MRAMVLTSPKTPLELQEVPIPRPSENQVLIKVHVCGICRTDLHIVDGELTKPKLPLILGHQIVGTVIEQGSNACRFKVGQRVGVPWIGKSCNHCPFCLSKQENLCDNALYTGYQTNGGYAEYCVADENYCFSLPDSYTDLQIAPFLCAGLIGFRGLRMAGNAKRLGFYGFGSSAHILIQIARHLGQEVYAFTRPGDTSAQELAKSLGAIWVGSSEETPPVLLDAALVFASVGSLIPTALKSLNKGSPVISLCIHMSDIPSFSYDLVYGERIIRSVMNLTRQDGEDFFKIAAKCSIHTQVTSYPLEQANQAIRDLHEGKITGSAVLTIA